MNKAGDEDVSLDLTTKQLYPRQPIRFSTKTGEIDRPGPKDKKKIFMFLSACKKTQETKFKD